MELEEAIKRLTLKATTSSAEAPDYPNCIVMKKDLITILKHLVKQEKMIDLMAERIEYDTEWFFSDLDNKKADEIKQYFEKKAEKMDVLFNIKKILDNYDELEPVLREFFDKKAQKEKFERGER